MPSPMTLRVDKETRQRIALIAHCKQVSASEVIRQAIETWIEQQEPAGSPYEMVPVNSWARGILLSREINSHWNSQLGR